MTIVTSTKKVADASVVRDIARAPTYPGLDHVGEKLGRGLAEFLGRLMEAPASVGASATCLRGTDTVARPALRHVGLSPLPGAMSLAMDGGDLMRLVDLYYGGEGPEVAGRDHLSPAEDRFFTRIATGLCGILPAAWKRFAAVTAELIDEDNGNPGQIAVQVFAVTFAGGRPFQIECHYPQSMLEAVPGLQSLDSEANDTIADGQWQERLMDCALHVPLPVRAVFAEPELPLARLMALRPGDIIPVSLPPQIDLSVAGLPFARGSAGESNGRSAVCIEHL